MSIDLKGQVFYCTRGLNFTKYLLPFSGRYPRLPSVVYKELI